LRARERVGPTETLTTSLAMRGPSLLAKSMTALVRVCTLFQTTHFQRANALRPQSVTALILLALLFEQVQLQLLALLERLVLV